ncbi:unnamed protein product [Protopolystoma xenopodis]|uniref:Uncharacterized protein n=1 Tax=Protopolystoma xenopodis TaxID=117903 RepID=A0A3S5A444_9PLAT|nr:unnamed protein product [Protopolystoma xenopodis]
MPFTLQLPTTSGLALSLEWLSTYPINFPCVRSSSTKWHIVLVLIINGHTILELVSYTHKFISMCLQSLLLYFISSFI